MVGASVYNDQNQSIGSIDDILMSDNDHKAGTLTAEVDVAASGASLYALTAAAAGASGDYSATSLSPSATWSVAIAVASYFWAVHLYTHRQPR